MLTPEQIADGWIEHNGGKCPVDPKSCPAILWGDGHVTESGLVQAHEWGDDGLDSWEHQGQRKHHIIAYKLIQ